MSNQPNLSRKTNTLVWTIQGVLALLFLFAGGSKLALPAAELAKQATLPIGFLRFIGACEVAGALGLVLPGLLGIRTGLTPLAALGLVVIMGGAVVVTLASGAIGPAVLPLVVGALAGFVALRRRPATRRLAIALA